MAYRIEEAVVASGDELMDRLVACWRASVEATHDFLARSDVERIARYVPDAIESVAHLAVCRDESGRVLGFAGVEGSMVEMLFVDPGFRGQGLGTLLLDHAVKEHDATMVDVNEQNGHAVGFYRHYGFEVTGRSETDAMGEPFPLLHMRLAADHGHAGGSGA